MNFPSQQEVTRFTGRRTENAGMRRNTLLIAAGAALAAAALVVRQRTLEAERDNPPLGKFIEVEGIRLHYVERGEGQPLVLLHGDGSMIQDFELSGLIDLAAKKYRVIAFDRPGYGYSERPRTTVWTPQAQAELLHFALHRMGIERPIVLGHSWGTLVAIALALQSPDYVKSLVLLSGYYYPTARLDVPLLSPPAIPIIGDLLRYTISPLIGRMIWPAMKRRIFSPAPIPERFSSDFPVWMTLRPSQLRASAGDAAMMIPAAYSLHDRYRELAMPVVIMAGDGDKHADMHVHSEALHQDIPHSTLHVTRGAGHMIHHLVPEEVMRAIDEAAEAASVEHRVTGKHVFPASVRLN
ncbi:alpha/beta hydrolase [Noviherbaspirillum sp.]|jgi:pimeloyl-ACP methyl ester carboxylesterase|uniref:alpha/beta fold hydrolase n=1 Tax=Noviherbaspirillum sp. TaxID=1926288 RepID=UPI0025F766D4|nr:alpha/beta hydrolase [Noviherbaspirillum sp.]